MFTSHVVRLTSIVTCFKWEQKNKNFPVYYMFDIQVACFTLSVTCSIVCSCHTQV